MKRILCLMLSVVLLAFSLVSCGDDVIGAYKENYPEIDNESPEVKINMYIIIGEDSATNAKNTVSQLFEEATFNKFKTRVNLVYCTAAEYSAKMTLAVSATDATAANIVLVDSADTMGALVATGKLADLTAYVDDPNYGFGSLNKTIPETLMNASKIDGKYYAIPNNHVIGEYKYLVINKKAAQACGYDVNVVEFLNAKDAEGNSIDPYTAAVAALGERMTAKNYNVAECIKVVTGNYETRKDYEADSFCLEVSYPTATADEAFKAAFAIVNRGELENLRAMQIIYAINSDETLRNLLQYGVRGTNYNVVDGDIVRVKDEDNTYTMNLLYTGNVFIAAYCSDYGWTEAAKLSGIEQNKASVN